MNFSRLSKFFQLTQNHLRAFATKTQPKASSDVRMGEIKSDAGYGGSRGKQYSSPTGGSKPESKPAEGKTANVSEGKSQTSSGSKDTGGVRRGDIKSDAGYGGSRGQTS